MDNILIIKISLIFLSSLAFSFLINSLFLKFSKSLGIRDIDDKVIRWSTTSKPAFGGIAFFITFLLTLTQYLLIFDGIGTAFNLQWIGIVTAISIGFLIGLADDAYNTNPALKFIGQAICAITLILTGSSISLFESDILNFALSFLWVIGLMNSINMLDNMDGISTTASIMALVSMLVVLSFQGYSNSLFFILIIGLIASLCGFLYFNWHPSRMYMGDSGSQFLGISLAAFSIPILWNFQSAADNNSLFLQIILPILAFIVPLSDTTTVVINRIKEGRSPFIGGKDHTTHHLSYLGLSDSSITIIVTGIGVGAIFAILIAISIENWLPIHTILYGIYAISIFLSLFLITVYNNNKKKKKDEQKEDKINYRT